MLQYESGVVENVDMNSMLVVVPYETGKAGYQSSNFPDWPLFYLAISNSFLKIIGLSRPKAGKA